MLREDTRLSASFSQHNNLNSEQLVFTAKISFVRKNAFNFSEVFSSVTKEKRRFSLSVNE